MFKKQIEASEKGICQSSPFYQGQLLQCSLPLLAQNCRCENTKNVQEA
jgi:hypothetical protein